MTGRPAPVDYTIKFQFCQCCGAIISAKLGKSGGYPELLVEAYEQHGHFHDRLVAATGDPELGWNPEEDGT